MTSIESAKYYATTLPGGPKAAALVEAHSAEDVVGEEAGVKLFEVRVGGVRRSSKVVRPDGEGVGDGVRDECEESEDEEEAVGEVGEG